jgi:signal transduction histidine kinase
MVDQILEIGRLESGEMPLSLTAVALPDLVDSLLNAQMPRAATKQLTLINDLPAVLPSVWADAGLLERILKNLIHNAVKFTPDGGEVRISAESFADSQTNEPVLHISVTDTGPGISEELLPNIFNRFVTGSHVASGSGLGLAFCKMSLIAHGQDIWVNNNPETGATFTFSLPVAPTT